MAREKHTCTDANTHTVGLLPFTPLQKKKNPNISHVKVFGAFKNKYSQNTLKSI